VNGTTKDIDLNLPEVLGIHMCNSLNNPFGIEEKINWCLKLSKIISLPCNNVFAFEVIGCFQFERKPFKLKL